MARCVFLIQGAVYSQTILQAEKVIVGLAFKPADGNILSVKKVVTMNMKFKRMSAEHIF